VAGKIDFSRGKRFMYLSMPIEEKKAWTNEQNEEKLSPCLPFVA
jgi:hypothetical protein